MAAIFIFLFSPLCPTLSWYIEANDYLLNYTEMTLSPITRMTFPRVKSLLSLENHHGPRLCAWDGEIKDLRRHDSIVEDHRPHVTSTWADLALRELLRTHVRPAWLSPHLQAVIRWINGYQSCPGQCGEAVCWWLLSGEATNQAHV